MSTEPGRPSLPFAEVLVARLFPFLLVFDRELRLLERGRAFAKVCPDVVPGKTFHEIFSVHRPRLTPSWEKLVRESERNATVFLDVRATALRLRGQLVLDSEGGRLYFAGGPWFTSMADLERSGVSLDELTAHDPIIDFLSMVQAKSVALADAERFSEIVSKQRDELEATNAALSQALASLEEKLAAIEEQRRAIRGLSTPVIEVWDGLLCLPVVGAVDPERASEMTETLLGAAVAKHARCVIVDLTGIQVLDTSAADHLLQLTRALGCLGTECVLTGISGAVARTLVDLGVDMTGFTTRRSLRAALRHFVRAEMGRSKRREDGVSRAL